MAEHRPLLVAYKAPINRLDGGNLRLWHLFGGGQADVICFGRPASEPVRGDILDPLPWRSVEVLKARVDAWPSIVARAVAERRPSHIVVHVHARLDHIQWLRRIGMPFTIDYTDCYSLHYGRRLRSLSKWRRPISWTAALIRHRQWLAAERVMRRAAARTVLSGEADREAFAAGSADAVAISNGTDWTLQPPIYEVRDRARVLAFHGNIAWRPNFSAIEFVCRQVLPLVRREIADAEFQVAGGPLLPQTRPLAGLPGVKLLGYVEDLRQWFAGCDVYAMPMVEGSGVKNKLLEAMAAGFPVVANPRGAEGLDPAGRALLEIGEDAAGMARRIVGLLRDPARRAASSAAIRAHAVAHYGWETYARKYRDSLVPLSA
ncbi:MAG: glycosyltransferase [Sphingomonadales bacterium]